MNAAALLVAYLIGIFPTGRLIARLHGVDITTQGSGNVGATNVARTLGKKAGIITLLGDVVKGALACAAGAALLSDGTLFPLCGLAAVLGHCYSIPGLLKGGKGVATSLGVFLYLSPLLAGCATAAFAGAFFLSRTVSIASLAAAVAVVLFSLVQLIAGRTTAALPLSLLGIAAIVTLKHAANIRRIVEGTEPKFKSK